MHFATLGSFVQTMRRLAFVYFIFYLTQAPDPSRVNSSLIMLQSPSHPELQASGQIVIEQNRDESISGEEHSALSQKVGESRDSGKQVYEGFEDRIFRFELADSEENPFLWQYVLSFQPNAEQELKAALSMARSAYEELLVRRTDDSATLLSMQSKMRELAARIRALSPEKDAQRADVIKARLDDFLAYSEQWSRNQVDVDLAELRLEGLRKSFDRFRDRSEISDWLHTEIEQETSRIEKVNEGLAETQKNWAKSLSDINLELEMPNDEITGLVTELRDIATLYRRSVELDSANQLILDQFERVFAAADQAGLSPL